MKSKSPIIKQISWAMFALYFIFCFIFILIVHFIFRPENINYSVRVGFFIYLMYSLVSRFIITREHRKGIRLVKKGQFEEAIPKFENSNIFFQEHSWIDKYRWITIMSCSAISYREMALVNMAFCYAQIGDADKSKEYYEMTLKEFPESTIAQSTLNLISTFEKNQ